MAEPYSITYMQFRGMIVGFTIAAFTLAVFTFGCCEIRTIKKRDDALRAEIARATNQSIQRVVRAGEPEPEFHELR